MHEPGHLDLTEIHHELDWNRWLRTAKLKILFVTDGRFDDTDSVYDYMRNASIGCTDYVVHRALYGSGGLTVNMSPDPSEAHYSGFQFLSVDPDTGRSILDKYHVVYLFATLPAGSIEDDEAREIHRWMEAGGGIFATGDHSTLGQYMGSKIPRVGTMRKWTELDLVPLGTGEDRLDTNQPDPAIPGQVDGTSVIPITAQGDAYPQPIDWQPMRIIRLPFQRIKIPHEILCHPEHGPIDVMPDHPHEGECVNPGDIQYNANVKYDSNPGAPKEYPTVGHQEKPVIIAKGTTAYQYSQAKGDLNRKVFNMISVYDGHKMNVGRVVVDSTWHHWYGMNIDGLIAAGGKNWDKIGRYFLNVAKYLAPEGVFRDRCYWDLIAAQLSGMFVEEVTLDKDFRDNFNAGQILGADLRNRWGPCAETDFIIRSICDVHPEMCRWIERDILTPWDAERPPLPDPVCLSCPPFEYIRTKVLEGVVRGTAPLREQLAGIIYRGDRVDGKVSSLEIRKMVHQGVAESLAGMQKELQVGLNSLSEALNQLERANTKGQ